MLGGREALQEGSPLQDVFSSHSPPPLLPSPPPGLCWLLRAQSSATALCTQRGVVGFVGMGGGGAKPWGRAVLGALPVFSSLLHGGSAPTPTFPFARPGGPIPHPPLTL